ncbi:hypothetical protein QBC37DRAFT_419066 [Rhypophila decipiens]|uniref:Uncharacterized protein n=1 Tax=Rhypophila decipiens TaxID=261697 RepID=A0AAN6YF69_9PEZI|nr:hypothetical protein QBC37DRAFT_419066 [Rhypophila decipiens]
MAATVSVRATYGEDNAIATYLANIFGYGQCSVIWRRARYICRIPRYLTAREIQGLQDAVRGSHYSTD